MLLNGSQPGHSSQVQEAHRPEAELHPEHTPDLDRLPESKRAEVTEERKDSTDGLPVANEPKEKQM